MWSLTRWRMISKPCCFKSAVSDCSLKGLGDAEQRRFDAGESSLFLVNQRERGLLYETTKLADAEVKRIASTAKLATALGYPARLPEP